MHLARTLEQGRSSILQPQPHLTVRGKVADVWFARQVITTLTTTPQHLATTTTKYVLPRAQTMMQNAQIARPILAEIRAQTRLLAKWTAYVCGMTALAAMPVRFLAQSVGPHLAQTANPGISLQKAPVPAQNVLQARRTRIQILRLNVPFVLLESTLLWGPSQLHSLRDASTVQRVEQIPLEQISIRRVQYVRRDNILHPHN